MAGLGKVVTKDNIKKTAKEFANPKGHENNALTRLETNMGNVGEAFSPDNSALEKALEEQNKVLPMADEEELKRARRRRGGRGRGRTSTILSQGEGEGLGG